MIENISRREGRKIFKGLVKTSVEVLHISRCEAEKRVEWVLWGGIQEEIGIPPNPEDKAWQMVIDILMQIPTEKHDDWRSEFVRIGEANKKLNPHP